MVNETVLDDFLLRHVPRPPARLPPALVEARQRLDAALEALVRIDDSELEQPWPWRDIVTDVRYCFYRQYEALELARAEIAPGLVAPLASQPPARPLAGAATAARWELHGLLIGLRDELLDADPGGGEWTVRQTLAHIVGGQRAYGWFTAWWLAQRDRHPDEFPAQVPDELSELLPDESTEAEGSMVEIRRRFDDIVDLSCATLGVLSADEMAAKARWAGQAVTVGFRVGRWASHIREHTIQVDKTLAMLGHQPTEVARLVRLIAAAYGRLEESLFMLEAQEAGVTAALSSAGDVISGMARDVATVRRD